LFAAGITSKFALRGRSITAQKNGRYVKLNVLNCNKIITLNYRYKK
jgi:hypothetical protein